MDEPQGDDLRTRQFELETDAVTESVQRLKERRIEAKLSHSSAGAAVLETTFFPLAAAIEKAQEAVAKGRGRRPHEVALLSLDPEKLALITIREIQSGIVLSKLDGEVPLTRLARDIGHWCLVERKNDLLRGRARDLSKLLLGRNKNPWHAVRRAEEKALRFEKTDWSKSGLDIKVGAALLELAVSHSGLVAKKLRPRKPAMILLTPEAVETIRALNVIEDCLVWPAFRPMIEPPLPWRGAEGGGFQALSLLLVKERRHPGLLERVKESELRVPCEAVNALQETAWRVNRRILEVAEKVWERREPQGIPWKLVPPPRSESVSQEEHEEEASNEKPKGDNIRRTLAMGTRLSTARTFQDAEAVYFPYQLDHRGRAYSIPQILQPQADDLSRALLGFATGKPLGVRGSNWLSIHLANCFGLGKHPFPERAAWVEKNRGAILDSAARPLEGARFWTKADKPWRFLAAAMEWKEYDTEGLGFLSRVPVAMDGTCNGLQHLSALGRDPEGGLWTNLVPGPKPQDIYQQVAGRLEKRVMEAAAQGNALAARWIGAIDRVLVKPSTMTTPYGVSDVGIRGQILEAIRERFPDRFPKPGEAASFLAPHLKAAIAEVVVKAAEITRWLQELVKALARKGHGLSWTAPSGFPVLQERRRLYPHRIRTVRHAHLVYRHKKGARIDLKKQRDGIVANLVHSLDAAHMMLTARALRREGVFDMAMVHDSFAVHARDVDLMNAVLRDKFLEVHQWFGLGELASSAEEVLKAGELPPPPKAGRLDIEQVINSDYFFS